MKNDGYFLTSDEDKYAKAAEEALGGEVAIAIPQSNWGEMFGHQELPIPDTSVKSASLYNILKEDIKDEFYKFYGENIIMGENWFTKIETPFGAIAYIHDHYPCFYMRKEDALKLIK